MSAFVCCLLVSVAWYTLAYLPAQRQIAAYKTADRRQRRWRTKARMTMSETARRPGASAAAAAKGVFNRRQQSHRRRRSRSAIRARRPRPSSPISFPVTLCGQIHADGYEDYKNGSDHHRRQARRTSGTVQLVPKTGTLSLTSPQTDVTYTLTGPGDYSHDGQMPDKLDQAAHRRLHRQLSRRRTGSCPPSHVTIHDQDNVQQGHQVPLREGLDHQRAAGRDRSRRPHHPRPDPVYASASCGRGTFHLPSICRPTPCSGSISTCPTSATSTSRSRCKRQGFHRRLRHAHGLDSRRRLLGREIRGAPERFRDRGRIQSQHLPARPTSGRNGLVGKRQGLLRQAQPVSKQRRASCPPVIIIRCRPSRNGTVFRRRQHRTRRPCRACRRFPPPRTRALPSRTNTASTTRWATCGNGASMPSTTRATTACAAAAG